MPQKDEIRLSKDDLTVDRDGHVHVKHSRKAQEIVDFLCNLKSGTRAAGKTPAPRVKVEM